METIFYIAEIAIQGERVLRLIDYTQERAIYEIVGFIKPVITLIDHRPFGIRAIQNLLRTGDLLSFAPEFNVPARVGIQNADNDKILIELYDTDDHQATHMLWIVVGLRDSIPVYDYVFEIITPLEDDSFAFVALFAIPKEKICAPDHSAGSLGCEYSRYSALFTWPMLTSSESFLQMKTSPVSLPSLLSDGNARWNLLSKSNLNKS